MELKLNDSEVIGILTLIDDTLGYDLEPLERETLMNVVRQINGRIQYKHHNKIDEFVTDILNTDYVEA